MFWRQESKFCQLRALNHYYNITVSRSKEVLQCCEQKKHNHEIWHKDQTNHPTPEANTSDTNTREGEDTPMQGKKGSEVQHDSSCNKQYNKILMVNVLKQLPHPRTKTNTHTYTHTRTRAHTHTFNYLTNHPASGRKHAPNPTHVTDRYLYSATSSSPWPLLHQSSNHQQIYPSHLPSNPPPPLLFKVFLLTPLKSHNERLPTFPTCMNQGAAKQGWRSR